METSTKFKPERLKYTTTTPTTTSPRITRTKSSLTGKLKVNDFVILLGPNYDFQGCEEEFKSFTGMARSK